MMMFLGVILVLGMLYLGCDAVTIEIVAAGLAVAALLWARRDGR